MAATKTRTTVLNKIIAWLTANNNHEITGPQVNEITTDMMDVNCPSTALDGELSVFKKDANGIRTQTITGLKYNATTKRLQTEGLQASQDIMWSPSILSLTGGSTTALDGLVTLGTIPTGTIIAIYYDSKIQFYQLQASTAAESVPNIIRPDDWSGSHKVAWIKILIHSATDHDELRLTTNNVGSELYLAAGLIYYNNILKVISAATIDVSSESDGVYIFYINSTGAASYSAFTGFPFTDTGAGKYYIALFTMNTAVISDITDIRYLNNVSHPQMHGIDSTDNHNGVSGASENNIVSFNANGLPKDSGIAASGVSTAVSKAHDRAHDVLAAADHQACAAGDKGKFIRFNASTGAIEAVALSSMNYGDFSSFTKLTVNYGDLSVAATTKQIEVVAAMPAKGLIIEGFLHLKTNFTGGSISAITMAEQNNSDTFASALSVFSGAGNRKVQRFAFATNNFQSDMANAWAFNLLFTSVGANLNALGAGAVDVYYKISYLP